MQTLKNMKLGNRFIFILFLFYFNLLIAEEKITTSPLINVEEITPSFDELDEENENILSNQNLKEKKKNNRIKAIPSSINRFG